MINLDTGEEVNCRCCGASQDDWILLTAGNLCLKCNNDPIGLGIDPLTGLPLSIPWRWRFGAWLVANAIAAVIVTLVVLVLTAALIFGTTELLGW